MIRLRRHAYGTAVALAGIGAIAFRDTQWAYGAVLAVFGFLAGTGLRNPASRLLAGFLIDQSIALAAWWMLGPGTAVDLIPIAVISVATFILPMRQAALIVGSGELLIALRIPLHQLGSVSTDAMYWSTDGPTALVDVVLPSLTLMALALVAALLFIRVAAILNQTNLRVSDSELRFHAAFDNSATGMAFIELDGSYQKVNQALCELFGLAETTLLTMSWQDVTHPEDVDESDRLLAEAVGGTGEQSFTMTKRYVGAEGLEIGALVNVTLIRDGSGNPSRFFSQIVDITDSIAAQELLRVSEQRYRQLFERIPVAMYRSTPDGQILAANPALIELMGFEDPEDLLALDAHEVYVDPTARSRWIDEINETGTVIAFEEQLRRKDGTTLWGQDSSRTIRGAGGRILYYEGAIIDVTAQKSAEQARQRLTRIIEATPDIVLVLDPDGWVTYANSAARRFFSIDEGKETPYFHVSKALDRDTMNLLIDEVIPALREGEAWTGEIGLRAPDGSTMPVSAVGLTHRTDQGSVARFSAILRDVSEQVEARKQLQDLVTTKDEFVASVSHELRTPLTAVVGLAQELSDSWRSFPDQELEELIGLVADQATEVSSIVQDLLVAARADIGSITINPTIMHVPDEILGALKTIPTDISERLDLDLQAVEAWADPGRFRQIIRNLVTNALRYGGPNVRIHTHNGDGLSVVEVTDDGQGIATEDRLRIFDPYFRAHAASTQPASVGLGLTVSRQLAELMNGTLTYDYVDGLSRFTVALPMAR